MAKQEINVGDYLGESVWSEDDALPHDRERLDAAVLRIIGWKDYKAVHRELEIDTGDAYWYVYPDWVICSSYPGNTAIYKRK